MKQINKFIPAIRGKNKERLERVFLTGGNYIATTNEIYLYAQRFGGYKGEKRSISKSTAKKTNIDEFINNDKFINDDYRCFDYNSAISELKINRNPLHFTIEKRELKRLVKQALILKTDGIQPVFSLRENKLYCNYVTALGEYEGFSNVDIEKNDSHSFVNLGKYLLLANKMKGNLLNIVSYGIMKPTVIYTKGYEEILFISPYSNE